MSVDLLSDLLASLGLPSRPGHHRAPSDPEVIDDLVEHIETEALLREMRERQPPSGLSDLDDARLRALLSR